MRKIIGITLILLLAALILIQFIRPQKNISKSIGVNDITTKYFIPDDVQHILKASCYDCHSNNTRYPWYNKIQPVAWWLNMHVRDGKAHLNFDDFLSYIPKKQDKKMAEVIKEIKEGGMPLKSYTWIHTDAKLTMPEKTLLMDWAANVRKEITAKTGYIPEPEK